VGTGKRVDQKEDKKRPQRTLLPETPDQTASNCFGSATLGLKKRQDWGPKVEEEGKKKLRVQKGGVLG